MNVTDGLFGEIKSQTSDVNLHLGSPDLNLKLTRISAEIHRRRSQQVVHVDTSFQCKVRINDDVNGNASLLNPMSTSGKQFRLEFREIKGYMHCSTKL